MKILVVSNLYPPDFLGGYELGCRQAVEALRAAGHNVQVLAANPRTPVKSDTKVMRELALTDVYEPYVNSLTAQHNYAERFFTAHGINSHNVYRLLEIQNQFDPDVTYFWNTVGLGGIGLVAATQMSGRPWVMHIMDAIPNVICQIPFHRQHDLAEQFGRLARGRFLCCSQIVMREIIDGGVPIANSAKVIPNWVTSVGDDRSPSEYMPNGKLRIVSAGSISTNKGIDILIDSAALLRQRGLKNFSIDIYGHCGDSSFMARILEAELSDYVRLAGVRTQAQLAELYSEYDVFAFPTWAREPFGFAPMEAGSQGCLMLMSEVCGLAEWFVGDLNCVKTKRNAYAFADAFEQLISGSVPIADIAVRGTRTIRKDFQLDAILPSIEEELTQAAKDNRDGCSSEDVYRTILLAERMFRAILQETV